jgi:tetraacyldisaccharide 4'-kinase
VRLVARALEEGRIDGRLARAFEAAWVRAAKRRLVKPLAWREGARVVAIGGATLGGSGKTPLAIACVRALTESGARVALVGHAYRARASKRGAARVVTLADAVDEVGDEALACARALPGVPVVVAPTRQAALDLALTLADVAVLDGVHQTAPRASLALLAVDARAPWGSGACPPRGDLRASRDALVALADLVVPVAGISRGAFVEGQLVPWERIRGLRVGLVTALARPGRVLAMLASHDVDPAVVRTFSDHGRGRVPSSAAVDLWLTTAKCRESLESTRVALGVLDYMVPLPPECRLTLTQEGSYPRKTGFSGGAHRSDRQAPASSREDLRTMAHDSEDDQPLPREPLEPRVRRSDVSPGTSEAPS